MVNRIHKYLSYNTAIEDAECWEAFHEFIKYLRKEEQTLFLNDHKDYDLAHELLSGSGDSFTSNAIRDDVKTTAEILISRYIREGSSRQLNLSAEMRDETLQKFEKQKNNPSRNLFETVVSVVHYQLRTENFDAFISSDLFEQFVATSLQKKSATNIISVTAPDESEEARPNRLKLPNLKKIKRSPTSPNKSLGSPVTFSEETENEKNLIIKNLMEDLKTKTLSLEELEKQIEKERMISEELRKQLEKTRVPSTLPPAPQELQIPIQKPRLRKNVSSPVIVRRNSPMTTVDAAS
jgi:hypothetical protein